MGLGDRLRLTEIHLGSEMGPLHQSYEYDPDGRLRRRRDGMGQLELELHYDARGRVVSADVDGSPVASYRTDPLGQRIEVNDAQGVQKRLLEGEHLEAVYDAAGAPRATFLRGTGIDEVVNAYRFDAE